ncbi:uncharacterized protein LOC106156704 [Lingula anatina]|uniref:Uncharacterized protein LOC106156704 n=1 Tax=Lingula anatina TaxID=7574 RepID=A0A1S3HR70_LINAN|nr:uncharacterized protein LOC106156704 [Lingula anatina]|eukprot:XP_013387544.1 uncharacterized protein LOC106156704 [Lingula anatina]
MERHHKNALLNHEGFLYVTENMHSDEVAPHLIGDGIISDDQYENIATQTAPNGQTNTAKNTKLMEYIMMCDPAKEPFEKLCKALDDTDQSFLKGHLQSALSSALSTAKADCKDSWTSEFSTENLKWWCFKKQTVLLIFILILLCTLIFMSGKVMTKLNSQTEHQISSHSNLTFQSLFYDLLKISPALQNNGHPFRKNISSAAAATYNATLTTKVAKNTKRPPVGLTKGTKQSGKRKGSWVSTKMSSMHKIKMPGAREVQLVRVGLTKDTELSIGGGSGGSVKMLFVLPQHQSSSSSSSLGHRSGQLYHGLFYQNSTITQYCTQPC